jgi:hypothetical protein
MMSESLSKIARLDSHHAFSLSSGGWRIANTISVRIK